jgi:hypothetical protein
MTDYNTVQRSRPQDAPEIKAILREGSAYRLAVLILALAVGGCMMAHVAYTPTVPLIELAGSLVALTAGIRAGQLARQAAGNGQYVGGFVYTAFIGGVIMFIAGGLGALGGAVGHLPTQLNLSWPAAVISVISAVYSIRIYRSIPR